MVVSGCLSPPSPSARGFGDDNFSILTENMEYQIGSTQEKIIVPQGFVTDYASIPWPLGVFGLSPRGTYSRAAILHDFLYWSQVCTRAQSDRLMVLAMKESKVSGITAFLVYHGVNLFGQSSWDQNERERKAGLLRVIPRECLVPRDPNMDWPSYRKLLVWIQKKDPAFRQNPSFCVYGDTTEVPMDAASTGKQSVSRHEPQFYPYNPNQDCSIYKYRSGAY